MESKYQLAKRIFTNHDLSKITKKGAIGLGAHGAVKTPVLGEKIYENSLQSIKNRMDKEDELDDILDTVLDVKPGKPFEVEAVQLRNEIKELTELVDDHNPETIMEIGTLRGGTFYIWSRYVDSAEHLISVDLPGKGIKKMRDKLLKEFAPSKEVDVIRGSSHSDKTLEEVEEKVEKVDFLLIDGDHSYEGVKEDFEMYKDLVAEGGIIAFHDIVPHASNRKEYKERLRSNDEIEEKHVAVGSPNWGVAEFWDEIEEDYETQEFIAHPDQQGKGIGVIYV